MGRLRKFEGTQRYLALNTESAGSTPYPKVKEIREDNIDTLLPASKRLKLSKAKNSTVKCNKTKCVTKFTATPLEVHIKNAMNTNDNLISNAYTCMVTKRKEVLMPNKIQVKKLKGKKELLTSTPYPKVKEIREGNIDTPLRASKTLKLSKVNNSPVKCNKTKRVTTFTATPLEVAIKNVVNTNDKLRSSAYTRMVTKRKKVLMPNKMKKLKGKNELLTSNGIFLPESGGESPLLSAKVNACCEVVLKYIEGELGKKESSMAKLFGDEPVPIDMQITTVKIPVTPTRFMRILLPHSLVTDTTDVCLLVPDVKGKKNDIEAAVDHYRHIITANDVPRISQIVPLLQLRTEYHQYEMRRKLSSMADVFLVDGRISHFMMPLLGKYLYKGSHKIPVPFQFSATGEQLKSNIEQALCKTTLKLSSGGDTFAVQVGHSQLSAAQLASNITTVGDQLTTIIPGGWDNIRSLRLKMSRTIAFPLYLSLKSPNDVVMPVVNSKRPKRAQPVEGELSTTGGKVRVMPDGKVIVKNISKKRKRKTSRVECGDTEVKLSHQ